MKALCAALAATLVLALASCGGSGDSATSAETNPEQKAAAKPASDAQKPRHPVPHLPAQREPLETLIVKDVKVGDGPVAEWGDKAMVRYVGLYYETGKIYSDNWEGSWTFNLDGEQIGPGWQKGIHGMRVGGQREIFIPARLIFDGADGDIAYVLELLKVTPGGD
jgi:peptidylprolyl isomerase